MTDNKTVSVAKNKKFSYVNKQKSFETFFFSAKRVAILKSLNIKWLNIKQNYLNKLQRKRRKTRKLSGP